MKSFLNSIPWINPFVNNFVSGYKRMLLWRSFSKPVIRTLKWRIDMSSSSKKWSHNMLPNIDKIISHIKFYGNQRGWEYDKFCKLLVAFLNLFQGAIKVLFYLVLRDWIMIHFRPLWWERQSSSALRARNHEL